MSAQLSFYLNYPDKLIKKYLNCFLLNEKEKKKISIFEDLTLQSDSVYYVILAIINF